MNEYSPNDEEVMKKQEDMTPTNETGMVEAKNVQEPVKTMEPKVVSEDVTLLKCDDIDELKASWDSIQVEFVDEPRKSVEEAEALLVKTLEMVDNALKAEHSSLTEHFINHDDVSTEELRVTLQSYRKLLNRIFAL